MPHPDHPRRRLSAFTLIELLTVIAIIGILAAIIIPTVGKVRQTAKNAQCVALLREWGRVIQLYANENKGNYTVEDWASAAPGEGPYRDYFTKSTEESKRMRTCPMHPDAGQGLSQPPLTYALVWGHKGNTADGSAIRYPMTKIPLGKAKDPSRYMLMVDTVANSNAELFGDTGNGQITALITPMCDPALSANPTGPKISDTIAGAKRHGSQKINAVFGDGSLKRVTANPSAPGDPNAITTQRPVWFRID